jgi:hypothetical protein
VSLQESCRDKEEREVKGGSLSRVTAESASGGNVREGARRISDDGNHCAAASDAMETDGKRARKGRMSGDGASDRRGTAFKGEVKGEEQVAGDNETGGERRKSSRGSGVGESGGGSEGVSSEADALSRSGPRLGKAHNMTGESDETRDEVREAKAERKARSSKAHEAALPEPKIESKVEAKRETKEGKELKEEGKKTKRKSENGNGDVKMEKGVESNDVPVEEAPKEERKAEVEGKPEEDEEEKEEEKQEKRGKKSKKEKREEKEREASCADAADNDRPLAENEKAGGVGHGAKAAKEASKQGKDASEIKDASQQDKNEVDAPVTPRLPPVVDSGEDSSLGGVPAQSKEKEGKEKEKKRSSKGASELAALQADVSKSDMLSSITDTGKRRCTPATYFTYDDTGNQAEIAKANLKSTVHRSPDLKSTAGRSPDKLESHRGKTRELAGLGVEPTRAGRRAVLDALEDPPRRERQVPDRFDAMAAPKAKKPKPTPPQAKTGAASRRGVNGKDAEGGEDDGDTDNTPANGAASHAERRGKDEKVTAASRAEAHEDNENGHGGRGRGAKKGAAQKEEEEDAAMGDANESRGAARATRKRGSKHDEAAVEAETDTDGATGPPKKRGKGNKKDRQSEIASEDAPKDAVEAAGDDVEVCDGNASPRQRADGNAPGEVKNDEPEDSSERKPGQEEPEDVEVSRSQCIQYRLCSDGPCSKHVSVLSVDPPKSSNW